MRFAPFGALAVLLCACVACGGGGNSIAPLPSVTATPDGNPTAVPIPVVAPFFVETTLPVSVGTSEDSIAFAGGPYAGVLTLDAPASTVTSGLTVDLIVQSDTPVGFPALQSARRSAAETRRTASATGPVSALLSLRFVYSATLGTTTGSLTVTCPAAAIVPGAAYYAAYYDPNALSFGYQFGWAGPAAVSGNRLTFTLPANTTFVGRTTYVMTMYALSVRAPIPTPVPKPTPSPTPSASPSVAPTTSPTPPASPSAPATAAPSTNPSSTPSPPVAPSATPTSTPSPSPTPSPNPTQTPVPGAVIVSLVDVSIPAPGSSVNLTVSETGYVGLFNEQDSCGGTTPIAQINPRSGSGPSFTTTIVGLNPGVCVATFRDSGSGSATISIKVTSSGFTIKSKGRNTK